MCHSGIKLSDKRGQKIPFKICHHDADYSYCNIKCALANLTDSEKNMECNRDVYSTRKKSVNVSCNNFGKYKVVVFLFFCIEFIYISGCHIREYRRNSFSF